TVSTSTQLKIRWVFVGFVDRAWEIAVVRTVSSTTDRSSSNAQHIVRSFLVSTVAGPVHPSGGMTVFRLGRQRNLVVFRRFWSYVDVDPTSESENTSWTSTLFGGKRCFPSSQTTPHEVI